jgi:hypothetical protein
MSESRYKIKGSMVISRTNGPKEESIRVEFVDKMSGVRFAEAKLSPEAFVLAVMGAYTDCNIEVVGLDKVGKRLETKTVVVPFAKTMWGKNAMEEIRNLVKKHEVDGWKVREYDLNEWNSHHVINTDPRGYSVSMYRYVDE